MIVIWDEPFSHNNLHLFSCVNESFSISFPTQNNLIPPNYSIIIKFNCSQFYLIHIGVVMVMKNKVFFCPTPSRVMDRFCLGKTELPSYCFPNCGEPILAMFILLNGLFHIPLLLVQIYPCHALNHNHLCTHRNHSGHQSHP